MFEGVCEQIRHDLAKGALRPGDKLPPERELAESFGVGRGAIREALRTLETSGVLELRKGVSGGAFVRAISPQGLPTSMHDLLFVGHVPIRQLTEVRTELLGFAVRLACERGTSADLDEIEANIALTGSLQHGRDGQALLDAVNAFYDLLAAAAHNELLSTLIGSFAGVVRSLQQRTGGWMTQDALEARRSILLLMRARDAAGASAAIQRHIEDLQAYVLSHISEDFRTSLVTD